MSEKFVLFDFDGVIADSYDLSLELSKKFDGNIDEEAFRALFEGNIYDSLKKRRGEDVTELAKKYFAEFVPRMRTEAHLVPGMDSVVTGLAGSYTLIIVSSTPSDGIRELLSRYAVESYFAEIMGMDVHTSKIEKIGRALHAHRATASDCVFVTDTLGDIREAEAHGIGAIGVSWGVHSHETLEKGIPFRIVDKPEELPDAVDDYFAH